ncbi:hypothetical protein DFI_18955 (plasmid) [Deinococcus ficus]|uniref:Uncharacterized protein n=2 Tax=Deinococcus ficus TaxID=317577 RepID=A0A221T306_9DEIO|nr:hypothetical protein DFI_18955 [Deinococcus ficus]
MLGTALFVMIVWMFLTPVFGWWSVAIAAALALLIVFGRYGGNGVKAALVLVSIPVMFGLYKIISPVLWPVLMIMVGAYGLHYLVGTMKLMAHRPVKQAFWVLVVRVAPLLILWAALQILFSPPVVTLALLAGGIFALSHVPVNPHKHFRFF